MKSTTPAIRSPFKGLTPFDDSDLDAQLFFGRERETEIVVANVLAARLTVLYGPSGVGKSSLLRAGVAQRLRSVGETEPLAVAVFSSWSGSPLPGIEEAARAGVADALGVDPGDAHGSTADRVDAWTAALGGELCLILDQLEEFFLYHGDDAEGRAFADQLADLVTRPRLRVNVLLGIRDDALARLDAFKSRIPGLFANSLRLDRLDRDAARTAVLGPLQRYNELAPADAQMSIEPALLDAVLAEVAAGRIDPGLAGRGGVDAEADEQRIEAPYLQLVLQRLWEVERERGSGILRLATFRELGGAERMVEDHLERAMAALTPPQQDVAAGMFDHLVTPSGMKIAHGVSDLATYAHVGEAELAPVVTALAGQRILRPLGEDGEAVGDRYEIFHDVLADAVLAWRTQHETTRALERERAEGRRRLRRLALVAGIALAALAVTIGLAVYAFAQSGRAADRARSAKARELTLASFGQLREDPGRSLLLALEAANREQTPAVADALRAALVQNRGLRTIDRGAPLLAATARGGTIVSVTDDGRTPSAAFSPDGRHEVRASRRRALVTVADGTRVAALVLPASVVRVAVDGGRTAAAAADGTVVVGETLAGRDLLRLRLLERPTVLALSPDGRRLVAGSGKIVRVVDIASGRTVAKVEGRSTVLAADVSPDGSLLATGSADGAVRLWTVEEQRLADVFRGHENLVRAVVFTPDGERLITGSADTTARVWRVEDGHPFAVLAGHADEVRSVAVSSDGRVAVTASSDGTARTWDASGDPELAVLTRFDVGDPTLVGVDGGIARVRLDAEVADVDLRSGRVLRRAAAAPADSSVVDGWQYEIDGRLVRLSRTGKRLVLRGHQDDVTSVRVSPNGSRILTASADHDVREWSADDGAPLRVINAHVGRVTDARYSPNGRWIVTAGPSAAGLWNTESGQRLFYLRGHDGLLTGAAFAPDGRSVVTSGMDGTLRSHRCGVCGGVDELVALAERRLARTGRTLTAEERRAYLGED